MRIYRKAVGFKSYFLGFYRVYSSVLPSITAVLAGHAVSVIAEAIVSHNYQPVIIVFIVLISIEAMNVILGAIYNYLSLTTDQDVYIYVSELVSTKYIQIPLRMRETREFADKFERVQDFGSSITFLTSSIVTMFSSILSTLSVFVATLTISPIVTAVVIAAAIPSSIISLKLSAIHRRNWREWSRDRRVAWMISQKITNSNNALEIEMNGLSSHLVHMMVKARRHAQEQDIIEERKFLGPRFGASLLETIVSYGVMFYVAIEIILGRLGIGQLLTIRTLLNQLSSNISGFFTNLGNVSENLVNSTDFMEFMEIPLRQSGDIKITGVPKIEFKNVSFSYPNTKTKAIKDVSFVINPGESLAIVGKNGAGKTTIIKLLIGAYEPTDGVILINDQPLEKIDRESYLAQIGALFQEYARYEFATLGENVWFGDVSRPINKKEVERSLHDVGLEELSKSYEKGLGQILSKDLDDKYTTDLSGGQWQRLSIARAFYRSPNVLVLDEPTATIDIKAEYEIFRHIISRQKDKTTLIISHRFSTVRKADKIIVLDKGRIVEEGMHDELIAQKGLYKEMFELQAEGYN